MEKVWVIENPDEYLKPRPTPRSAQEDSLPTEADPALAYTLSLLFWGSGQLYNGQRAKGLDYVCLALYGNVVGILLFMFQQEVPSYLRFYHISPAQAVLAAALLIFTSLIFWISNASDAFHTAVKARRTQFQGVSSRFWPPICSLLVPGWGQFLNGQPVKGGLFAVVAAFGIFSLISVLGVLLAWPFLEDSFSRNIVEGVLLISLFSLLPMPFIWILGAFDAWKVTRDDIKKEPLLERLKAANNRRRDQGWVRGVFPQIKRTFLLGLFLTILVVVIARNYFPWNYYREFLTEAMRWSTKQGMALIPEFFGRVIAVLPAR